MVAYLRKVNLSFTIRSSVLCQSSDGTSFKWMCISLFIFVCLCLGSFSWTATFRSLHRCCLEFLFIPETEGLCVNLTTAGSPQKPNELRIWLKNFCFHLVDSCKENISHKNIVKFCQKAYGTLWSEKKTSCQDQTYWLRDKKSKVKTTLIK